MNINYLIEQLLHKQTNDLFDSNKPNDDAKYVPKFLKNIKSKSNIDFNKRLKSIFTINPRTIRGTNISIDANDDEREADEYLRKQGFIE